MRNISRITPCCKPPIERINSMPADCNGDFTVEQGPGARVTTITNGIRIEMLDLPFSNTDGNIILDEPNRTIDLNDDIHIDNDLTVDGEIIVDVLRNNHHTDWIEVDCGLQVNDFVVITGDVGIQGRTNIVGTLHVSGDIVQDGASYETHAEKVYTTNDYIYMRDEAVAGLAVGAYSGFQVIKYDGTNDGRLVIDNTGTARVGDVGDEQPLLTRAETGSLTDGQLFKWDSANSKAIGQSLDTTPTSGSSAPITSDAVFNTIKPIDITNSVVIDNNKITGTIRITKTGKVVEVALTGASILSTVNDDVIMANLPRPAGGCCTPLIHWQTGHTGLLLAIYNNATVMRKYGTTPISGIYQSFTYITND